MAQQNKRIFQMKNSNITLICWFWTFIIIINRCCCGLSCQNGTVDHGTTSGLQTVPCTLPGSNQTSPVTHCMIFRHHSPGTDPQVVGDTMGKADFMCDTLNICDGKKMKDGFIDVFTYHGMSGDVYCCQGDGCNKAKQLQAWAPQLKCYTGASTDNKTPTLTSQVCPTSHSTCMSSQHLTPGGSTAANNSVIYSCDVNLMCKNNNIPNNTCTNITQPDKTLRRICCCNTTNCNQPKTGGPLNIAPTHPLGPMPTHPDTVARSLNWVFVSGVVGAVILCLLLTIVVVIVIKKCRQRQQEQFAYVYSQLTADLSEELIEDSDTGLIIA